MNDDAQLIAEALRGRSDAFGRLVERYQDRLYNTLVHLVGSAEDARDVAQDAFVQAFVKLETFRQNSQFYTWLYRIAFNLAMTRRRRPGVVTSIEQVRDAAGIEPVDDCPAPSERIEGRERDAQVREALARLSEEHRTVIVLREIDGLDYEAIAEVLEVPVGTVRSRLHRARLELRDQLKEVFQADM
ncbi:MAG: sigma-70 family RNA polymerase sigma factor [Pirellulales bacterium]|nr:sigma-70 family RNA polymerase sigma factor [Pirellulales bacterium]